MMLAATPERFRNSSSVASGWAATSALSLSRFLPWNFGGFRPPRGLGRDTAALPPTLKQPTDPRRADPEEPGDLLPRAEALVASLHDPFPKVHRVGFHAYSIGNLYKRT